MIVYVATLDRHPAETPSRGTQHRHTAHRDQEAPFRQHQSHRSQQQHTDADTLTAHDGRDFNQSVPVSTAPLSLSTAPVPMSTSPVPLFIQYFCIQVLHYLDRHIVKGNRPPLQSIWPGPIQQLLTRGWSPAASQRPAAAEFSTLLPTLMGADMRFVLRTKIYMVLVFSVISDTWLHDSFGQRLFVRVVSCFELRMHVDDG